MSSFTLITDKDNDKDAMEKSWGSQIYYLGNFKNTLRLLKNMQLEPVTMFLYTRNFPPCFQFSITREKIDANKKKYGWLLKTD